MSRLLVIVIVAGLLASVLAPVSPNTVSASTPPANVPAFFDASLPSDVVQRYIVLLDGINSSASASSNVDLNDDFGDIKSKLQDIGVSRFVYFSYGAAAGYQVGDLYCGGWGEEGCSTTTLGDLASLSLSPVYTSTDTHLPVDLQANALEWLLGQIVKRDPAAKIDLVGFSLGGIVASYWAAQIGGTSPYRSSVHSIVLIESPVGGIPGAGPATGDCISGFAICLLLRAKYGIDFLREMQLPAEAPGSIVGLLPQAARNFPLTSIQSTTDYFVNDLPLQLALTFPYCGSLLQCTSYVPIGQGTQWWIDARHTRHWDKELGGDGFATVPLSISAAKDRLEHNHMAPLHHEQTADWVNEAVQAPSAPTDWAISISAVNGQFFANPTGSGAFTAKPGDPVAFSQSFPVINFNPPGGTVPCSNPISVGVNTRPFTAVVPQPDGSCLTIVAQGNGQQAGVGNLFAFNAVFVGSISMSRPMQATLNFFSDDGWILSIGPNAAGAQPSHVSGPLINPPQVGPFTGYSVVGSYNTPSSPTQNNLVVNFPAAGTYAFELDYSECCAGELALTLTANGQPIPQGGTISGKVYANNIAPTNALAGAFVQVCEVGGSCRTNLTSASGQYTVSGLPAGQYMATAFPPGNSNLLQGKIGPLALLA